MDDKHAASLEVVRFYWRYPAYGRLWVANCLSMVGDILYNVATVWFLVSVTKSALTASGIAIGTMIGALIGGALAAAFVDRWHPRSVMVVADAVRAVGTLGLAVAWMLGASPSPLALYILAGAMALCHAFFQPARTTAIAMVVPRDQLIRAGAAEGFGTGLISALSWGVSGVIASVLSLSGVLLLNTATFALSLALVGLGRWKYATAVAPPRRRDSRPSVALRWLRRDRLRSRMVIVESLHAFITGLVYATLPLFVLTLGGTASTYGLQGGLFALAILAGSLYLGRRVTNRIGLVYAGGIAVNAIGILLMVASPSVPPFLVAAVVAGLGVPAWTAARQVIFQVGVPGEVRGRVFAILDGLINLALLPTWTAGAWLADTIGARTVMAIAPMGYAGILALIVAVGIAKYRTTSAGDGADIPGGPPGSELTPLPTPVEDPIRIEAKP